MAHLRNPFGADVVERRPIVDSVADEERIRLHNKHISDHYTLRNNSTGPAAGEHTNSFV